MVKWLRDVTGSALITGAMFAGMHFGFIPQEARLTTRGHGLAAHALFFDPGVLRIDVEVAATGIEAVARHNVMWSHDHDFSFGIAAARLVNPRANLAPHELVSRPRFDHLDDGASGATAKTVDERRSRRSIAAMHEKSGHCGNCQTATEVRNVPTNPR